MVSFLWDIKIWTFVFDLNYEIAAESSLLKNSMSIKKYMLVPSGNKSLFNVPSDLPMLVITKPFSESSEILFNKTNAQK